MALTDLRQTVLQIVNEVQRKLAVNVTSSLTETSQATLLLRFLNETVAECADHGRWLELLETVLVTAQSSVSEYAFPTAPLVQNIYEIRWGTDPSPLEVRDLRDIRRLTAVGGHGTPRQFGLTGVGSATGNPKFKVYPVPTTAKTFDCAVYVKPQLYTTADGAELPRFPANVLIAGTYAKALLDENGGERTLQFDAAYREYLSLRGEAQRRFTSDTGSMIYFRPQRGYR